MCLKIKKYRSMRVIGMPTATHLIVAEFNKLKGVLLGRKCRLVQQTNARMGLVCVAQYMVLY